MARAPRPETRSTDLKGLLAGAWRAAAVCDAVAAIGLAYMVFEAQRVRRLDVVLPAPDASADLDGLAVALLSDFHAGFRPSLNAHATRKAVDMVVAARPHLVLIAGDFACGPHGLDELCRQLRRLTAAAPLGVFAVLGNHDHGDSKAPFVRPTDPRVITGSGVRLLTNELVSVAVGNAVVHIGGVDDTDGGHDDLPAVLAALDRRPGALRLLLAHHARVVLDTQPGDFHLTVAGDTHGGQICLPLPGRRVLLSDPSAPFAEGAYDLGGRRLYVTRGVGTSMLPLRAFCRPEIVVFRVSAGPTTGSIQAR